jgi:hypothetical protein
MLLVEEFKELLIFTISPFCAILQTIDEELSVVCISTVKFLLSLSISLSLCTTFSQIEF